MTNCHLAQSNIARMLGPLEDPVMAGFVERLDALNALADASPGFVWRYQTEEGNATEVRVFDDELIRAAHDQATAHEQSGNRVLPPPAELFGDPRGTPRKCWQGRSKRPSCV